MGMAPDLLATSARQHGFVRCDDVRAAGTSRAALRHQLARGDWTRHGPRLLHRTGTPWTKATLLLRAVLDAGPGAVLSHGTAAAWWGLPGFDLRTIHVTRPRGITSAPARFADVLHAVVDLSSAQVTVLDGIPVVRPERAIFELCATVHPGRAERALDAAWTRNLCSGASLRAIHTELAGRGRAGTCAMRTMLEARPDDWVPPASNLERRFQSIMDEASLGRWRRQVDVGGADGWCGRVDFLHEVVPAIVEVQSERYHLALTDQAADAARRARLEQAGFLVVEVWDREVWHDKAAVVAAVRPVVRAARRAA